MNKTKYTKAVCMLVTTVLLTTLMSGCSIAGISNTWSELKGSLVGNNYNITFYKKSSLSIYISFFYNNWNCNIKNSNK